MSPVSAAAHLPTRCPNCKGPVFRRGAGWTHGASVWCYCFFCTPSWKRRVDDPRANSDGELTGEMFVVGGPGKKLALGSVLVCAIDEDALKPHLERRTAQRELGSRKLEREIDALAVTLVHARAEEERLWTLQQQDEGNFRKAKAWSVSYNNTKKITRQLEDLRARRQHLTSGAHFFQDLPSPISAATTNGDGTFTLAIPRVGRYGIVARASRARDDEKQTYVWFVSISLDGE